jgi:RNA polymerase sigma-70 factor (ECF subfamily)
MAELAWQKLSHSNLAPVERSRVPDVSEQEIIAAAKVNPAAFEPLYATYHPIVLGYCYRRVGHDEQAADLTSQIFLQVLRALPDYAPKPGSTFRSWLFTIAHNVVIESRRRDRHERSIDVDPPDGRTAPELIDAAPTPEDQVLGREQRDLVRRALGTLPERRRQIVELRLAGLSGAEIASTLGITLSAVKSAQFHAYAALRDVLDHPTKPESSDAT